MRRDLRLDDHVALSKTLRNGKTILVFVFDKLILGKLEDKQDQRVSFIYDSLKEMEATLKDLGSSIIITYGDPVQEIPRIAQEFKAQGVYCNRDYEPYAKKRDLAVSEELKKRGIAFNSFKDSVIFEKDEILTKGQTPFKVYTPYKNKWLEVFEDSDQDYQQFPCKPNQFYQWKNPQNILDFDWYQEISFIPTPPTLPGGRSHALARLEQFSTYISQYDQDRNYPIKNGTSLLSIYLRHGNISVREMVRLSRSGRDEGHRTWLNEIIWRDFYQMILDAHPHVAQGSYKPEYDQIKFLGSEEDFISWCQGETGYPLIDAAMRCLNQTGLMHNRLRMVCASFLCKTLLVDWRKGEEYFARKLLDFDLAANNGGWQWSASSGCDAQPYFRIFNPYSQSEKFDADGEFIRLWVPELSHLKGKEIHHPDLFIAPDYPRPVVSYEQNRKKCLKMYEVVKNK